MKQDPWSEIYWDTRACLREDPFLYEKPFVSLDYSPRNYEKEIKKAEWISCISGIGAGLLLVLAYIL